MKKHLNADEMLGIGDSYNDLPLFKASDYSFTFHSSATQNVI
jgi:phosphoserine phosphatase